MKALYLSLILLLSITTSCGGTIGWEDLPLITLPANERSHVLIEDYTGQRCVNCPQAAQELSAIAEELRPNVVVVSMHAPHTGQTLPELAHPQADEYAQSLELPRSAPHIAINRKPLNGEKRYLTDRSAWHASVWNAVHTPRRYDLEIHSLLSDGKVNISLRASALKPLTDTNIALRLWVVEDIRAEQRTFTATLPDYLHHNVFRQALNGVMGERISISADAAEWTLQRQYELPARVVDVRNAKIVAMLVNMTTQEIVEVALTKIE